MVLIFCVLSVFCTAVQQKLVQGDEAAPSAFGAAEGHSMELSDSVTQTVDSLGANQTKAWASGLDSHGSSVGVATATDASSKSTTTPS